MTNPSPSDAVSTLTRVTGRGAPSTSRTRVLAEIAAHYTELVQPSFGANGPAGDEPGLPLMPHTYTATVREFERLLRLMRDDHHTPLIELDGQKVSVRQLAWHLREWHLNAERVIRWVPVTAKRGPKRMKLIDADGNTVKRPEPRMRRHPQAKEHLALEALRWMAERWGLATEPMLPAELTEQAA